MGGTHCALLRSTHKTYLYDMSMKWCCGNWGNVHACPLVSLPIHSVHDNRHNNYIKLLWYSGFPIKMNSCIVINKNLLSKSLSESVLIGWFSKLLHCFQKVIMLLTGSANGWDNVSSLNNYTTLLAISITLHAYISYRFQSY